MPPSHSAQGRGRGLSARQWQDLRQAARLARSESVTLTMHGVKISPDNRAAGNRQPEQRDFVRGAGSTAEAGDAQMQDADNSSAQAATATKKSQRDALRAQAFRERKRVERWRTLCSRVLSIVRRHNRDDVWTAWMRSKLLGARLKLRNLLWREWTRPQHLSSNPGGILGPLLSSRDEYIHKRCCAFCRHLPQMTEYLSGHARRAAADAAGDAIDLYYGQPVERRAGKSSLSEAGIPTTPGSARVRKKRGGKKS